MPPEACEAQGAIKDRFMGSTSVSGLWYQEIEKSGTKKRKVSFGRTAVL